MSDVMEFEEIFEKRITKYLKQYNISSEIIYDVKECCISKQFDQLYHVLELKHIKMMQTIMLDTEVTKEDYAFMSKFETIKMRQLNLKFENIKIEKRAENNECFEVFLDEDITANAEIIVEAIEKNPIVLIRGGTGLGKTTKIPQLLMKKYKKICCTQPRRFAAINVANRVAAENKWKVGRNKVGYAVRFEKKRKPETKLVYMTDGLLLNEIMSNPDKFDGKYDVIFVDEAHERNINIDLLLGYMKSRLVKTKLVLMSATLESEKFLTFFNCPILTFNYKHFPVEEHYIENEIEFDVELCVEKALELVAEDSQANVLVFLPGKKDIDDAVEMANGYLDGTSIAVLPLYSVLPKEEQELVFKKNVQKIIFSTNIAETSITIPEITHVIDSGYFKEFEMKSIKTVLEDDHKECEAASLNTKFISKSQAKQRAGRAGRVKEGHVFRMYTKEQYENANEHMTPQIVLCDLSSVILNILAMGIENVNEFDFMDVPEPTLIQSAINHLYLAKALDENGRLTMLGKNLALLPVDYKMGLALIKAKQLGCFDKVATMFACYMVYPITKKLQDTHPEFGRLKRMQLEFNREKGLLYFYADIYENWIVAKNKQKWSKEFYLRNDILWKAHEIKKQLTCLFECIDEFDTSDKVEIAIAAGYFTKVAKRHGDKYALVYDETVVQMAYTDLLNKKRPKYVIFFDLFAGNDGKECFMKHCIQIHEKQLEIALNDTF